jgi:inner membrane protein
MPWSYWGLAAILPMVPDLDVFLTGAYGATFGHRGLTHSLLFAAGLGVLTAVITFRHFHVRWWLLALLFTAILASHGLLDAMTKGGENVPFFWPSGARFGNWGPLVVSDIAFDLPDPRYSLAIRKELIWIWLPTSLTVGFVTACRLLIRHKLSTANRETTSECE